MNEKQPIDVALVRCTSYEQSEVDKAVKMLLSQVDDLSWVKEGMTVAIKVNLVTAKKPDTATTTHPSIVIAVARELQKRGAKVIVGDSPGGIFNGVYLGKVYSTCGMHEVESVGVKLNQNYAIADRSFPEAYIAKKFQYTAWLDEADAVINICKLKTHGMMGLSAAVKNLFGVIPGTVKPEYHFRFPNPMDFAHMLIDLNEAFPIRLNIVDGIVGMEGNGPTAGIPREVGCLLASKNPYKLDVICAKVIGLPPLQVPTIAASKERGLIPENMEEIQLNTEVDSFLISNYKNIKNAGNLVNQNGNIAIWGKGANAILTPLLRSRPKVKKSECIGCKKCAEICPAKAITMISQKPQVNTSKCIRCFCCQEFCPKGAMKVHRGIVARIAGKL